MCCAAGLLRTDAYQLTMAQLYVRMGLHERHVRFEHFFRSNPDYGEHQAGYCVAAGLAPFAEWVTSTQATPADVEALRGHRSRAGGRLFDDAFLRLVRRRVDFGGLRLDAVAEGRVVHPNTPITVVEGPLAAAQLLETPLLNQLNFATLIATKAARVVEAARGRPVLEFGMRRAAADGADAASRAAIVGGAVSTSNTAVAYELGQHAGRHARPLDGPAVPRSGRRRAGRVRRLRRRVSRRHAAARRHGRHARAAGSPTPSPRSSGCAAPATSRSASGSTPATSPTSPCRPPTSSTRPGSPTP